MNMVIIFLWFFLSEILLIFNRSLELIMTYNNLVNYAFVCRIVTFIFSLYLFSPEIENS